jgi:hypothetical protein
MAIRVGEKIRHAVTKEEGVVIAISEHTRDCILVRFGASFGYLVKKASLERVE